MFGLLFRWVFGFRSRHGLRRDISGMGEGKWVSLDGHWVLVTGRKEFGGRFSWISEFWRGVTYLSF